jgi:biotin carboxyl carrier protein
MSDRLARDVHVLAALFKAGGWSELRVEADGIQLLLSTDPDAAALDQQGTLNSVRPQPVQGPPFALANAATKKEAHSTHSGRTGQDSQPERGWVAVTAPNLGTFYRSPKPGAVPFVELGDRASADTEICLLEVMKLFTSVKAGVAGIVRRICAGDAELVEGGQVLFYIEPE